MGQFNTKLHVQPHPSSRFMWVLDKELIYVTGDEKYVVPEGFPTDFASVPRFLWSFVPPYGVYTEAAVVHDYLYSNQSELMSRKHADELLYQMAIECGLSKFKASVMYRAVRWFGKKHFKPR